MNGHRVSKGNRCPICGGDSWCLVFNDSILCMRVLSPRPHAMAHGTGYWHSLTGQAYVQRVVRQEEPAPQVDFKERFQQWHHTTTADQLLHLSDRLGVRPYSLMDIGACYAEEHSAWAFPMKNASGEVIGARLRNWNGDKWAVKGSRSGVFYGAQRQDIAVVVEGPTDAAAVISIGLFAIGRPSNSGGVVDILHLIGRMRIFKVLIIADNDADKKRPDGTKFNPGMDGAKALQEVLPVPNCIVTLPCKDIRDFVKCGATSRDLNCIVRSMIWKYPAYEPKRNDRPITDAFRHSQR